MTRSNSPRTRILARATSWCSSSQVTLVGHAEVDITSRKSKRRQVAFTSILVDSRFDLNLVYFAKFSSLWSGLWNLFFVSFNSKESYSIPQNYFWILAFLLQCYLTSVISSTSGIGRSPISFPQLWLGFLRLSRHAAIVTHMETYNSQYLAPQSCFSKVVILRLIRLSRQISFFPRNIKAGKLKTADYHTFISNTCIQKINCFGI